MTPFSREPASSQSFVKSDARSSPRRATGVEALAAVRVHRPNVAVLDTRMPPTHTDGGLVAAHEIPTSVPERAVLVLSQYVEPAYAMRLIETYPGGLGYLLKAPTTQNLAEARAGALRESGNQRVCESADRLIGESGDRRARIAGAASVA